MRGLAARAGSNAEKWAEEDDGGGYASLTPRSGAPIEVDIARVFSQFDTSGDGYLQLDELKRAFRAIGLEKRKGKKYELDQKTFDMFDRNNDGKISLEEFSANLHPKTRAKIMEKLDAGWVFDSAKWTESIERHSKWNMAKVFKQVRSAAAAGRDVCSRSS